MYRPDTLKAFFAIILFLGAAPLGAAERYYAGIFGAEGEPNLPRFAHTFAVFVKTTGEGSISQNHKIEVRTISWLPPTLVGTPLRLRPETGLNLDLAETMKWAETGGASLTLWGPFAIKKELYDKAMARIAVLESGKLAYKALDGRLRGVGVTNCIHAVSDIIAEPMLDTGTTYGNAASALVVRHLQGYFEPQPENNFWLIERLGLQKYKIRLATPPTSPEGAYQAAEK